jgi:hypothetical protein
MFISFMGVSIPRQGQEKRAMALLIVGMLLLLLFVAAGVLTLFKLW